MSNDDKKVGERTGGKGCDTFLSEPGDKGGIHRFPPPTDFLMPSAELQLLKDIYSDVVNLINERGGKAVLGEQKGYPTIITFLPHPATIATVAEVLFGEKYDHLTPAGKRNVILNMMQNYDVHDTPKKGERLQ